MSQVKETTKESHEAAMDEIAKHAPLDCCEAEERGIR